MSRCPRLAAPLLFTCFLSIAGCGGGGGGTSGPAGSNSSATPSNDTTITADKNELRFVALDLGSPPLTEAITFSLAGQLAAGTYYASIEPDANATFDAAIGETSLTSLKVGLMAHSNAPSVDGSITFKLCKDKACNAVAWSRAMPYHIRKYHVDASEIKLTGFEGASATATRTISPAANPADFKVTVFPSDSSSWLSGQIDASGSLVVTVKGAGLATGNYSGQVDLAVSGNHIVVPVSLSLGSAIVLPADRSVVIGAATPIVSNGSIDLAFKGGQLPGWTASSDKPWLVLQSSNGAGATSVGYTIDASKLSSLQNFAANTASVTFKVPGLGDAIYKVTVEKKLPQIIAVSPNPIQAGRSGQLRLFGRGFQQLMNASAIRINNIPVAGGTIVSDSEAVINLGPMSAGTYALSIPVSNGLAVPQPSLSVVAAAPMPAALIGGAGDKAALLYNAARKALYTLDRTNAQLLRYQFDGATWVNDRSVPVASKARIGLSHDGTTLYVTDGRFTLEERDADTLAVGASYTLNASDPSMFDSYNTGELPITNDGRIWFSSTELTYFDTLSKKFGNLGGFNLPNSPTYAVSRDGSRMFVDPTPLSGGTDTPLRYDSATGQAVSNPGAHLFVDSNTVLSGDGRYVLTAPGTLYDSSSYQLIGNMPAGTRSQSALLSQDGSRIYAGAFIDEGIRFRMIRLDVVAAPAMTKLGEIALPSGVMECADYVSCNYRGVFTISPFGDTIFWAGNKKIAVIPVPAALAPTVAVARFQLR